MGGANDTRSPAHELGSASRVPMFHVEQGASSSLLRRSINGRGLRRKLLVHFSAPRLKRRWQMAAKLAEELVMGAQLVLPRGAIHARQFLVAGFGNLLETRPIQIFEPRHDSQRGRYALCSTLATLDDPLQDAHVLAVAGPDKFSIRVTSEPVDPEDLRHVRDRRAHFQP